MKNISAQGLMDILKTNCKNFPDERKGNAIKYSMTDATLGAFSVFFTQSPSFLSYQKDMEKRLGRSNANTLFSLDTIPTDTQIRNILDLMDPNLLTPVFKSAFGKLKKTKLLHEFKTELGDGDRDGDRDESKDRGSSKDGSGSKNGDAGYLIALDGIEYFSSDKIHCKDCLTKTDKKKRIRYYHSTLTPVVVCPGKSEVIPLPPEYIIPQDGHKKQDCENMAAKRWLKKYGSDYSQLKTTILGDDLYSRQPVIEEITNQGFHYILVCKPQSHKWTTDWIEALEKKPADYLKPEDFLHKITTRRWNGKYHIISNYEYALDVPIKDGGLRANWIQLTQIREEDGKQLYQNSFVTDHPVTDENAHLITEAGRTRWKVENENNNTLTTKGYHFKHNYGHGKKHLSTFLATLILIAYLFHTLLDLGCDLYQKLRKEVVVRKVFFNHIKTLTTFFNWESWDQLFDFMWKKLNDLPATAPE